LYFFIEIIVNTAAFNHLFNDGVAAEGIFEKGIQHTKDFVLLAAFELTITDHP